METKTINGITIIKGDDNLWRDAAGTVYALEDPAFSKDDDVRPGVGGLGLPADHWSVDGIRAHDYAFSSPQFQRSYTRSQADRMLLDHMLSISGDSRAKRLTSYAFYGACRLASWIWWDVPETRWK